MSSLFFLYVLLTSFASSLTLLFLLLQDTSSSSMLVLAHHKMDSPQSLLLLCIYLLAVFSSTLVSATRFRPLEDGLIVMPSDASEKKSQRTIRDDEYGFGTRWAVLVAGSSGYWNYRHQADICHAYQVLKRGGLEDENIVVFMYDDIAYNRQNPHPGVIINRPDGPDVYAGVPKDYTGEDVNVKNLFAVILGNQSAVTGGSGKVVNSGPNDHIFIYYTDHGGPGMLGMPTYPYLYANDLIDVLKQKHASGTYKEMVIYVEACESGSIFEGLLPNDLNIYVTTASNAEESSWGTYCQGMYPPPPPEYHTCLGDLYSVAWMEDSEVHNLKLETLHTQYERVKDRTSDNYTYKTGSHVMQYGDVSVDSEEAFIYIGSDPAFENTGSNKNTMPPLGLKYFSEGKKAIGVNQRDADLLYFWHKYQIANEGTAEKIEAQHDLMKEMEIRMRMDGNIEMLGKLLFGSKEGPSVLKAVRAPGQVLVDDWDCLKAMVGAYEKHCGRLGEYGMKHVRAFANICNAGIDVKRMASESANICRNEMPWI